MNSRRGRSKSREPTCVGTNVQVFTPLPSVHTQNRDRMRNGTRLQFGERNDASTTPYPPAPARERVSNHIQQDQPVDTIARNLQNSPPKTTRKNAPMTQQILGNYRNRSREPASNPNKRRHDEASSEKRGRGRPRMDENSVSSSSSTNFDRMRPNSPTRYQQQARRSVAPDIQSSMTTRSQSRAPSHEHRAPSQQRAPPRQRAPSQQRAPPQQRAPSQQRAPPRQRAPSQQRAPSRQRAPSQQRAPPQQRASSRAPVQQRAASREPAANHAPTYQRKSGRAEENYQVPNPGLRRSTRSMERRQPQQPVSTPARKQPARNDRSSRRSESSVEIIDDHEMDDVEQPPPQQQSASNRPAVVEERRQHFIDGREPCVATMIINIYNPVQNPNMVYAPNIFVNQPIRETGNGMATVGGMMEALQKYNGERNGGR